MRRVTGQLLDAFGEFELEDVTPWQTNTGLRQGWALDQRSVVLRPASDFGGGAKG